MLEYTPHDGAIARYRSPDGADKGSGPFDPSADWTAVNNGDEDLFNSTFSRRYGGVPFDRERHYHPVAAASEFLVVVASGLIPYALAHGWTPSEGTFSGSGDLSPRALYDFAYTAPEMATTAWIEEWKAKRSADPAWTATPSGLKETGRPVKNTWPWYLDRILHGHGERFTEWNSPAAVGHQQEIFDLCLGKLRAQAESGVDVDAVTLAEAHYWTPQPSLLLAALSGHGQAAGSAPVIASSGGTWSVTAAGLDKKAVIALAASLLTEVMGAP